MTATHHALKGTPGPDRIALRSIIAAACQGLPAAINYHCYYKFYHYSSTSTTTTTSDSYYSHYHY